MFTSHSIVGEPLTELIPHDKQYRKRQVDTLTLCKHMLSMCESDLHNVYYQNNIITHPHSPPCLAADFRTT